jgi:hypothetical protein
MVMTIDIPEKIVKHAQQLGVPVNDLVLQAIDQIGEETQLPESVRLGSSNTTQADRDAAGAAIREIASRNTLGGLKIKDLILEGRKY